MLVEPKYTAIWQNHTNSNFKKIGFFSANFGIFLCVNNQNKCPIFHNSTVLAWFLSKSYQREIPQFFA
jgi:hypothetical protein